MTILVQEVLEVQAKELMQVRKSFYISTAIAYTSAKPHIGNTYEIVLADALARYKRLMGYDVYFQTGTDEHGQKIEEKANEKGKSPQKFVDEVALEVKRIWNCLNTSYDKFVRTTNPSHEETVQKIFKKLYDQGDIYLGRYEGMYCTPCETFFTESQLVEEKCPDCAREVHTASEKAYFFKLGKYTERLVKHIEDNPHFIQPESRKNEIMNNFIKPGLQDLCVSRTSFTWGIPVDFDPGHVVYVWIDALSNYITFLGYHPDEPATEEFSTYWPADIHLIGKDILRFHTIYWPIMLMALGLPLPKKIFGHPWVLCGNDKMSKSKGNVMYADDLVDLFGVDPIRYYLLHEIPYANDGTLTYELLIERINSDLANILGNLVNRTISMSHKYFDGIVKLPKAFEDIDKPLITAVRELPNKVEESMSEIRVADAMDAIFDIYRKCNKYIDETTPWVLAKDPEQEDRLATVLYNLLEAIRCSTILLQAFLPDTADSIFKQLGTNNRFIDSIQGFNGLDIDIKVGEAVPLFTRIDKEQKLNEISNM